MSKFLLASIVLVSFAFGFGCSVGFETTGSENDFSCEDTEDCLPGYVCNGGVCGPSSQPASCIDTDGDTYGVGESRGECSACADDGNCEEDCAPDDENVFPGQKEICNGKDDNCDGAADEATPCDSTNDCGDDLELGITGRCVDKECVYQMTKTQCTDGPGCGCNPEPIDCVGGTYNVVVPEACK